MLSSPLNDWLDMVKVIPPPQEVVERFRLDPFYKKYVDVFGIPVVGSERVLDAAMIEAAYIARLMLHERPDVAAKMAGNKIRLAVMATSEMTTQIPEHRHLTPAKEWDRRARGLGATKEAPAVSCAEENLLQCKGDPYWSENILVHEFAHAVHLMGLNFVDQKFDKKLQDIYRNAMAKGRWAGTYAAENHKEYFAEGVQSYFACNSRKLDATHTDVDTREELEVYDPELYALIRDELRTTWKYCPPAQRSSQGHLRGLDRNTLPKFAWPG